MSVYPAGVMECLCRTIKNQEEEKMRKDVKKVIAPLLAAAMALSCTVCVSAAEDETIKLTVWGAEEDQTLLKELTDKFQEKYADQKFDIQIGVESESTAQETQIIRIPK